MAPRNQTRTPHKSSHDGLKNSKSNDAHNFARRPSKPDTTVRRIRVHSCHGRNYCWRRFSTVKNRAVASEGGTARATAPPQKNLDWPFLRSVPFMPRLGGAYCFRRVRSQRKSVDWGTMGPALGGAYECYAHISSLIVEFQTFYRKQYFLLLLRFQPSYRRKYFLLIHIRARFAHIRVHFHFSAA